MWKETRIHKPTVVKITASFVKEGIVIRHNFNFHTKTLDKVYDNSCKKKIRYGTYYILNLDSNNLKRLLEDANSNNFLKSCVQIKDKIPALIVHLENRVMILKKSKTNYSRWDRKRWTKVVQILKTAERLDKLLDRDNFLQDEINSIPDSKTHGLRDIHYNILETQPIRSTWISSSKSSTFFSQLGIEEKNFPKVEISEQYIEFSFGYFTERGFSPYDVLIFLSWSFPSLKNYVKFWNVTKKYIR